GARGTAHREVARPAGEPVAVAAADGEPGGAVEGGDALGGDAAGGAERARHVEQPVVDGEALARGEGAAGPGIVPGGVGAAVLDHLPRLPVPAGDLRRVERLGD